MDLAPLLRAFRDERPDGVSVREWSLSVTDAQRLSLGIKDRQAGNAHAPLSLTHSCNGRYLLVWEDGRVSRGQLERRQIEAETAEALVYARAAAYDDPDAAQVLGPAEFPEVELHDAAAAAQARGDTAALAVRLAAVRTRVDERSFRTWSGSFSATEGRTRLVTSAGLDVSGQGTGTGWYVHLNGEVGDGFSARRAEPEPEFEQRLGRLMDTAEQLGVEAAPMAGGVHPLILHPRVVEQYALETLIHHLEGPTIDHGEGRFSRQQFVANEAVFREDIELRLDPLQPYKSGSYRFTAEGLPAAPCAFIESGRLVQPVLDLKYARRLGLRPTPIPYGSDVLHFGGGRRLELSAALARAAGGALVLSVLGVHTQDTASGDFSLSAPQVLRIGDRGLEGRLRGTISGNLFDVLTLDELRFVEFPGETTPGLSFPCRLDPK